MEKMKMKIGCFVKEDEEPYAILQVEVKTAREIDLVLKIVRFLQRELPEGSTSIGWKFCD